MADDIIEEGPGEASDPGGDLGGSEFIPAEAPRPKSDIYTALMILTFAAFLGSIVVAGNELYDFYDVQFWVFSKK